VHGHAPGPPPGQPQSAGRASVAVLLQRCVRAARLEQLAMRAISAICPFARTTTWSGSCAGCSRCDGDHRPAVKHGRERALQPPGGADLPARRRGTWFPGAPQLIADAEEGQRSTPAPAAMLSHEQSQEGPNSMSRHPQQASQAVADRDRGHARLRTITATAGMASVVVAGAVAFALPGSHHAASPAAGSSAASGSASGRSGSSGTGSSGTGSSSTGSGLSPASTAPAAGSGSGSVTSGGS
jgi:hypothetical protein